MKKILILSLVVGLMISGICGCSEKEISKIDNEESTGDDVVNEETTSFSDDEIQQNEEIALSSVGDIQQAVFAEGETTIDTTSWKRVTDAHNAYSVLIPEDWTSVEWAGEIEIHNKVDDSEVVSLRVLYSPGEVDNDDAKALRDDELEIYADDGYTMGEDLQVGDITLYTCNQVDEIAEVNKIFMYGQFEGDFMRIYLTSPKDSKIEYNIFQEIIKSIEKEENFNEGAVARQTEQVEQQEQLEAAQNTNQRFDYVFTDPNGYKLKATIQIGSWIKGTEIEMLQKAWENVGGRDNMPLTSGTYSVGGSTKATQTQETAVYAFGKISFEYLTTDFPRDNFAGGHKIGLLSVEGPQGYSIYDNQGLGVVIAGTQYSDNISYTANSSHSSFVSPNMEKDEWGSVAFVISVNNVFTPDNPEGDPELDEMTFDMRMYGASAEQHDRISVSKTW